MIGGFSIEYVAQVVLRLALIVLAIVLHEVAHGYVAYRLGDNTAKDAGRLTLNPVRHLDLFGSVILPLLMAMSSGVVFAYAKPVPYNPANLRNRRFGELAVALAGPACNLLQALVGAGLCWALLYAPVAHTSWLRAYAWVYYAAQSYCMINLWLAFFNLIPLPPLDGASVVALFLNERGMRAFYKVKSYSMFILLLLLFVVPLYTPVDPLDWYFDHTAGVISQMLLPGGV